jgi:hypothetical protein
MKVTDRNGVALKVTDLEKAIRQAHDFKDRHHIPPLAGDEERQDYWSDLHQKLLNLKKEKDHEQL